MSNNRAPLFLLIFLPFWLGFAFLSDLQNEKGNDLFKKGQVGKAKSQYQSAFKSDPKSPEIAYNLGNALYKESSFKDSLSAYEKAARVPKDAAFQSKAFYNLGNALYRNQDLPKAIEFYKQALRLNPRDEDAKYNLELLLKQSPPKDQDKKQDKQDQKDQKQKQDKDQQQNKKDQKDDKGGSGGQGSKDQESKGGGEGESGEKKEQKDQGEPEKGEFGNEEKKEEQKEPQPGEEEQPSGQGEKQDKGPEQEEKEKQEKELAAQEQKAPSQSESAPKTDAQIRAEQILGALENQEQQVLKFQNDPNKPRARARRVTEKDW